eukprot:Pgem_evm1s1374
MTSLQNFSKSTTLGTVEELIGTAGQAGGNMESILLADTTRTYKIPVRTKLLLFLNLSWVFMNLQDMGVLFVSYAYIEDINKDTILSIIDNYCSGCGLHSNLKNKLPLATYPLVSK